MQASSSLNVATNSDLCLVRIKPINKKVIGDFGGETLKLAIIDEGYYFSGRA